MADEIRQKIVLEGEKEYSAALKEANRNLKTLRSELKAETAELGANATAQQKAETKGRNLQKQIEQQKKIVDTYQAALKEVKERYGDNSDEVAKWEQKLNNARYTLATMNNDLERSQQDLKKQEDALKSAGNAYDDAADAAGAFGDATDAAGQIADAVTFQSVMTAADNLTSRLTNALNFIKDVSKAAWDWMSDSGEWADTLATDSTKWGVDKETLQGWRYAARFIDTDVETIAGGFAKLTGRTDAVNKKLAELGIVADKGVEASEVFWQVIDVMHAMDQAGDTAGLEDVAKNIFGKSYQEMLPLIKAGRSEWEKYVQEANDAGYILTDEQVDKLTKFDDANQRLQASWESFQHTIAAELAPAFEVIAKTLTDLIDSFTEWSKTEEGQKTLEGLGDAIADIAKSIGTQDFSAIVNAAKDAIEGLTKALQWVLDNKDAVGTGIGAIATAFAGIKISKDVLSALTLMKGFKGGGGGGTTTTATNAASSATKGALWGKIGTWLAAKGGSIMAGLTPFAVSAAALAPAVIAQKADEARLIEDQTNAEARIEEIKAESGESMATEFAEKATELLGPRRDLNGEYQHDATGLFLNLNGGSAGENNDLLNSLKDWDPAQLEALLGGKYAGGWDAWNLLQRHWTQNDLSGMEETELLQVVRNAILEAPTWQEDTGGNLKPEDVKDFRNLPEEIKQGAMEGFLNGAGRIKIDMDGQSVGKVVAPYVSQEIAAEMLGGK